MKNADKPIHPDIRKVNNNDYKGLVTENYTGLTKREYFAAMSLLGLITVVSVADPGAIVKQSIALADELLKQLEL